MADAFMKQIEADAKERAEDRRQRKMESDKHKNEGNKAFREQKYAKALVCYDKVSKDVPNCQMKMNKR